MAWHVQAGYHRKSGVVREDASGTSVDSGVAFLTFCGVLFTLIYHRFIRKFHLELEDDIHCSKGRKGATREFKGELTVKETMVRTILMFAALVILGAVNAQAESKLPFQDFGLGLQYQTVTSDFAGASSAGTMYGLDLAVSGSYVDTLLNGQHNRFRFGDYLGVHATASGANYKSSGNQYFAGLGYSLGAQAGLAVTDYLDVGARYYVDFRDNKFGSLDNSQALRLNTAEVMLRLERIYLAAAAGSGKKAEGNETSRSSTFHARYLFSDGGYAGVMMDSLKIKYELTGRNDDITNIIIQFGIAR